jgi:hypothetical protein
MQPGTKDLQKLKKMAWQTSKKPQRFACQTPKPQSLYITTTSALAYSVISML